MAQVPTEDLPDNLVPLDDLPDDLRRLAAPTEPRINIPKPMPKPPVVIGGKPFFDLGLPSKEELMAANAPPITPGPHNVIEKMMQALGWPGQQLSGVVDRHIGEPARQSLQEDFGMSPDASAGIATALTLPARGVLEMALPSRGTQLIGKAEQALGNKFSRTNDVAFQRRQAAIEQMQRKTDILKPRIPSERLYDEVNSANPIVPLKELKPVLDELRKDEALVEGTGLTHPKTESIVDHLTKKYFTGGSETVKGRWISDDAVIAKPASAEAPFAEVRAVMKRLNERIGNLKAAGGEELGDAMQIKRGFITSLENASKDQVGEQWEKLRAANTAFKRELVYEKVGDLIARNIRSLEGRTEAGAQNISAGKAGDQLRAMIKDDPDLFTAVPKAALKNIENGLERVRQLPLFGAPPGVDAGSKNQWGKMLGAGAIGTAIGTYTGSAVLGTFGTLATFKGSEAIGRAMAQPGGIKLIETMMKAGRELTPQQMMIIGGFVKASENRDRGLIDAVRSALKTPETSIEDKINAQMQRVQMEKHLNPDSATEY